MEKINLTNKLIGLVVLSSGVICGSELTCNTYGDERSTGIFYDNGVVWGWLYGDRVNVDVYLPLQNLRN